ncbi:MAG: ATP-binding protein [Caulobacteraceae bacterium]
MDMRPGAEGRRSGDIARIRQILNNLVSNAVKFTLKGEVRVTIEGVGPAGGEGLKIAVTDTGIGVPADKLPLLFQKFTQVDSSTTRQFGGTGLGLAICRELAQLMGGSVWAKSRQGSGSTFFFSVPAPRLSAPKPAPAPEEPSALTGPAGRGLRVLAAEDNSTNQLVLKTVMATFGLDVDMVADGRQALDAWNARPYDLILMDIQMPVMDGLAATRAIRDARPASAGAAPRSSPCRPTP